MRQGLSAWSPCLLHLPLPSSSQSAFIQIPTRKFAVSAALDSVNGTQLTGRERRQLRSERRESKTSNWKEEVEERLMYKPKKKYKSWTEDLNLDKLADLGPQWWVVRVSRVSSQTTAELLAGSLARHFPDLEFKVYAPAVHVKRKLKNGTYSVKANPLFPGCVFLWCVLNKELHDFIREIDRVGGFLGSRVGNTKRQINRPKPVPADDMEAIFRQAKEEQEKADQAFREEQQAEGIFDDDELSMDTSVSMRSTKSKTDSKPKRQSKKDSEPSESSRLTGEDTSFIPGSNIRVTSGPFAEFRGSLKELNHKTGKATVGFMLFGKESLIDLKIDQIVAEQT